MLSRPLRLLSPPIPIQMAGPRSLSALPPPINTFITRWTEHKISLGLEARRSKTSHHVFFCKSGTHCFKDSLSHLKGQVYDQKISMSGIREATTHCFIDWSCQCVPLRAPVFASTLALIELCRKTHYEHSSMELKLSPTSLLKKTTMWPRKPVCLLPNVSGLNSVFTAKPWPPLSLYSDVSTRCKAAPNPERQSQVSHTVICEWKLWEGTSVVPSLHSESSSSTIDSPCSLEPAVTHSISLYLIHC